jgi:hypothetical protein
VLEARYSLHASPREVCDPIQPGVSVGNAKHASTGTLGMIVRDRMNAQRAILSNWHVLCGAHNASSGEAISQPGPLHLGTLPERPVGRLERWLPLETGYDAAIALIDVGTLHTPQPFGGTAPITSSAAPRPGLLVEKSGAVSGYTRGMVDGIEGTYQLDYSLYGDTLRWMNGVRIVPIPDSVDGEVSLAGDSGAVWSSEGKAVALHFGGEDGLGPSAEYALAQPIERVLELLDAEMQA